MGFSLWDYIRWSPQTMSAESADVWSTASLNNMAFIPLICPTGSFCPLNFINEQFSITSMDASTHRSSGDCSEVHMCVLSGVNVMLRKIAVAAASKPSVEITQDGETLSVKTSTSVRTTHVTFTVGQEFNEATVDGRPCTVHTHPQKNTSVILLYICLSVTDFPFPKHSKVQEPMKCVFMQSWSLMWTQSHPPSQRSYQTWHTPIISTSISGFHILMGTDLFLTLSISKEKHWLHIFVCLCSSQSFPCWETDSKISCEQTLQKGEGPKTSWTREMTNDGELILVRFNPAITFTFTFIHLADAFIQSDLQLHSVYTFSLVCVFPGNRTHNLLRCWRNALPLSHTGTLLCVILMIPTHKGLRSYFIF